MLLYRLCRFAPDLDGLREKGTCLRGRSRTYISGQPDITVI